VSELARHGAVYVLPMRADGAAADVLPRALAIAQERSGKARRRSLR